MAVSKQLYHEWKTHPVTDELHRELRESLESLVNQMLFRLEPNQTQDSFTRAFAKITDIIISWQPEIIAEEADA